MAEKAQLQQYYETTPNPLPALASTAQASSSSGSHEFDPPPYSAPLPSPSNDGSGTLVDSASQRQQSPRGPQKYPGLPELDYRLYSPPLFELSADCTTLKSSAPYLSSGPTALVSLIRAQCAVPPKPQIRITGKRSGHKVDFAVKLNLMSLLVPEDPAQRAEYLRCVGRGEPAFRGGLKLSAEPEVGDGGSGGGGGGGLEEWVRRFVDDQAAVKSFTLERVVANLDYGWLEGQIRSLVASTGYKGVVTVTFPVTHARVVVQNPDRVNKFLTSVTSLFTGRNRYEVVKAVWPFATHPNGNPDRRCVVQSEQTWWNEWKDPIKYAIATRRQGWVTNEDKLEAIMEGAGKGVSTIDWGSEL